MNRAEVIENLKETTFKLGSSGFVRLVDVMGEDSSIVQAARVSYGTGTKKISDDTDLIRYLLRHRHTTPFEMCEVKLHIRIPMDAWRQFIRHRTASVNEYSTRYSEAIDDRAVTDPKAWRLQSESNKQGSSGLLEEWPEGSEFVDNRYIDSEGVSHPKESGPGEFLSRMERDFHHLANSLYKERLSFGIAREQARKDLPLSTYTEAYWKCDLHNIFHFLGLRMDSHAQLEIREYANVIGEQILSQLFPIAWKAFLDYRFNAITLSAIDIITLRHILGHVPVADYGNLETVKSLASQEIRNKRELTEFIEKWKRIVGYYIVESTDDIKRD